MAAVVLGVTLAACPRPARPVFLEPAADAPYDVSDDVDFDLLRDRMWAMPAGAERDRARARLAVVLVEHAARHQDKGKHELADGELVEAAALFGDAPDAAG